MNRKWAVSIVLLLLAIDYFMSRPLHRLWDSLRDTPAYLVLDWWMSLPFTLFMFALLSAILTSFSGLKNWFRAFLLLSAFKVIFAAVTAASLYFRMADVHLVETALQSTFFSLPFVLVHLLLSTLTVMFLRDAVAGEVAPEVLPSPYFAGAEPERPLPQPESPPVSLEVAPEVPLPERVPPSGTLTLPIGELLESFPEGALAMSPRQIEELSPSVEIPFHVIFPQLPEGRIEVEALTVISSMPEQAFRHPLDEVARQFPDGKMELPLREVVSRLPAETLTPPQQEVQPDVDAEFPDPFFSPELAAVEEKPEKAAPSLEKPAVEVVEEEAPTPEEVLAPVRGVPEEALSLTEEERLLLERSRDVARLSMDSIISQFPEGAVRASEVAVGETPSLPETLVVPLELIAPQLANGEVKLLAKFILAQFPKACLSISEADIIRALPNGEVELPLREIVSQLPPEVLAPPEQIPQPDVEEMPDPFPEVRHAQPVVEEAAPPTVEGEVPVTVAPAPAGPQRIEPSPEPTPLAPPTEMPPAVSYAEMLQDDNPLALSVDTVVDLLPEGALQVSAEELKRHLGGETLKLPRRMVMGQLKEGRIVVPVEILAIQLPSEHLRISIEQIKARFAEGVVELPLREIVEQVLKEIAQPLKAQSLQPECEEISTIFDEFPQRAAMPSREQPAILEAEPEPVKVAQPPAAQGEVRAQPAVEQAPEERRIRPEEEHPAAKARTILRSLLQKCRALGISEHVSFAERDNSVVVLAPSSLNREAVGCGMIGIMSQVQTFCEDYSLGPPFGLVISSTGGSLVCAELVRGESARLILLASLNRGSAGFMNLLLHTFEAQLPDLSSLVDGGGGMQEGPCPQGRTQPGGSVLLKPDYLSEEVCLKIVAALAAVGIENHFSARTASGQKVLVVWGGASAFDQVPRATQPLPEKHPLPRGIFDIEAISRYCSDAGLGTFESLLLVTPQAKVVLDRSSDEEPAYLLCLVSGSYGEGLVRTKARRAVGLLEA